MMMVKVTPEIEMGFGNEWTLVPYLVSFHLQPTTIASLVLLLQSEQILLYNEKKVEVSSSNCPVA